MYKLKEPVKQFGLNCSDLDGECDRSKGLACYDLNGSKMCAWVFS
jgi:hypothetical protein